MITVGCVILAGGKSSRMGGINKALLQLEGRTYLERIASELSRFEERLISGGDINLADRTGFRHIPDVFPDCGPLGGLYSALSACTSGFLFVVPCDMPFFDKMLAEYLVSELRDTDYGIIYQDETGRLQPLCGIYAKKCIPAMKESLAQGKLKMMRLTEMLPLRVMPAPRVSAVGSPFQNINSPADVLDQTGLNEF